MTTLLSKLFIKNHTEYKNPQVRKAYGTFSSIVGIVCNLIVFGMKLTVGLMIHSVSVTADAFNNLSDSASNLLMLIGFNLSSKPADKEHPYGHGRIEYITSLCISVIILLVSVELFKVSFDKIRNPAPVEADKLTFIILLVSLSIKTWQGAFYRTIGKRIDSQPLFAASFDSFADVVATVVILASLLLHVFFGLNVDGYAGVFVALFIFVGGVRLIKEAMDPIIGEPIDHEFASSIRTFVMTKNPAIKDVHDLVVHSYGEAYKMATLDVELAGDLSLAEAYRIVRVIEEQAMQELGIELLLRPEPTMLGQKEADSYSKVIDEILADIDKNLDMHTFEITQENGVKCFSFELDMPYSYDSQEKESALIARVTTCICEEIPGVVCRIRADKSFTKEQ